jgi:hypothetical protein
MLVILENMVLAFEIAFLSVMRAKLSLFPVSRRPVGIHLYAACIRCQSSSVELVTLENIRSHSYLVYNRSCYYFRFISRHVVLIGRGNASSVVLHVPASAVPNSMVVASEIYISLHVQPEVWELHFYGRHVGFSG